jgi:hypothetical protein
MTCSDTTLLEDLDGIVRPRPKRGGFTSRGLSNDSYSLISLPLYVADQV